MNIEHFTFNTHTMNWPIAALILQPDSFDATVRYPTVVSVHPFGSCKEQT